MSQILLVKISINKPFFDIFFNSKRYSVAECSWGMAIAAEIVPEKQEKSLQDELRQAAMQHLVLAARWGGRRGYVLVIFLTPKFFFLVIFLTPKSKMIPSW